MYCTKYTELKVKLLCFAVLYCVALYFTQGIGIMIILEQSAYLTVK